MPQLVLAIGELGSAATARSDSQCMSNDLTPRAAAADWSFPPTSCISSTTPITPAPAARPMLVTREKMMASGNAPYRSPLHLHSFGGDSVLGDSE